MNPVETGGISPKLKSVTGSNCAENPQRFPRVNAPIREGSVTEGSECRAREDIPEIGCREGLEAAAPSTVKESPRRPCSGWRREKCWADGWPARVPYTAGEKQLCLLTCGSPAASGRAAKGERRTRPPTASPCENEGELDLHTKPRRVAVTDLSEESAFGAGRNAFAVWPRPVTVKRLSSFRPGGQERPGLAEATGLLGRFMLTRLRGCWREEDRPRAPQTVVGGRRVAWAPPLGGSLLGSGCSLDTEEEGVEKSLALLGMNCLRAAD